MGAVVLERAEQLLAMVPVWVPVAAVALVLVGTGLLVWMVKRSNWLEGIGAQAVVALGGVAISVHGLWGFATETAKLPMWLAIGVIMIFDAAEMTLLVMLYKAAAVEKKWTPQLRRLHRTAWMLVAFSCAMNAIHAPNWWSRPVLAAIPAVAAYLVELQVQQILDAEEEEEKKPGAQPGPVRLAVLLWQHMWAALFARLGLDAGAKAGTIARAALVRRAAQRVHQLRRILPDPGHPDPVKRRPRKRLAKTEELATIALDRADVATDPQQGIDFARRMAGRTGARGVAAADYADPQAVIALLERLTITAAADHIAASGRAEAARQAERDARQRADEADERAETARQAEETARQRAEEATEAEKAARKRAADILAGVDARAENFTAEEETARQRAATARQEADAARKRAATARKDEEDARQRAADIVNAAKQQAAGLQQETQKADARHQEMTRRLSDLARQVSEYERLREALRGDLAPLAAGADPEPLFRSDAKQAGWQQYLSTVESGLAEPTAAEMADQFGIDAGNARNWLRDFRAARAAQIAAQPRAMATGGVR
ncbi:DUF2637 domain-containing protein [Streptomyces xiamenensis]|uniref:DUF2637 domain-containing protein n=1 Tax=Streptomyces xiamenensis TaxID=408015 RepID=UPI0036E73C23